MRVFRTLLAQRSAFYKKKLEVYSQFNPTPLSLGKFTYYGRNATRDESFQFLRTVLPVRLASILKEFTLVPDAWARSPSISEIIQNYEQSFLDILQFERHHSIYQSGVMEDFTNQVNILLVWQKILVERRDFVMYVFCKMLSKIWGFCIAIW